MIISHAWGGKWVAADLMQLSKQGFEVIECATSGVKKPSAGNSRAARERIFGRFGHGRASFAFI